MRKIFTCFLFYLSFGLGTAVLASTDFNAMNTFWNSNTIVVAFGRTGTNTFQTSDMLTFTPAASGSVGGTPIQTLDLTSNGEYKIRRTLLVPSFPTGIPTGTTLTILLQAKFKNGQTINGIQTITVPAGATYDRVAIDIRGQIKDFILGDPSVYLIRIF